VKNRITKSKKAQNKKKDDNRSAPQIVVGDARLTSQFVDRLSVQCVVTSPPYWGQRCYGAFDEIGGEPTIDEYLNNLSEVFLSVRESLANDGTMWVIIGDAYTAGHRTYRDNDKRHGHRGMVTRPRTPEGLKPKDLIGLAWRIAFRLQSDGWYLRSESIWHKTNPMPESVKDRPHQSHEHIFLFSKGPSYKFDWNALRACDTDRFRPSRTVWSTSVNTGMSGHAAPFPLELIRPCILGSTTENDLVLDPFAGSGSVGVICKELRRRFVGIELIDQYATLARSRLGEHKPALRAEESAPAPREASRADSSSPVREFTIDA